MKESTKAKLLPAIQKFVASRSGEFLPHCSDTMLEQLLLWRLAQTYFIKDNVSHAEAILKGEYSAAYDAAQPVLETILERGCDVRVHGHHAAQKFEQVVKETIEGEDKVQE